MIACVFEEELRGFDVILTGEEAEKSTAVTEMYVG